MDRRLAQAAGKGLAAAFSFSWLIATPVVSLAEDSWRQDRACSTPHTSMVSQQQPGCYRAWCADTRLGKLCACVRESPEQTDFSLGTRTWKAQRLPPMRGDASHFRWDDDAGSGRLFVAMLTSESVGIAISDWLVWAIDAERISQPLRVQNYGTLSFATKGRGPGACDLLAAHWQSGSDSRRGPGTYITGKWYVVKGGEFVPMQERPTIYQRYLSRVERARYDAEDRERPFLWFRHATTIAPARAN
jgi:hypothetical protein